MKKPQNKKRNRRIYLAIISSVALSCGSVVMAQTNVMSAATNAVASDNATNVANLGNITVIGQLDQARSQILPDLGATAYTHTSEQIQSQSQGGNAPMNQVILRSPGVAQDSAVNGDLHVRGEHANLQYRINDVLLPEGITGFGLELDPRFVDSMQLITGSLPAQYGFRTAGVIDIQTKSGFENGGEGELYGGSYDTIRPSFEYGGTQGKWNYFIDGSYDHNDLGIENPTASHDAIHDTTDQGKSFIYASCILSDTSRVTFMGSASYSEFEVPNTPDVLPGNSPTPSNPTAVPWYTFMPGQSATSFNSSNLNERQNEQNYYGVVAYQKAADNLNYQVSTFIRNSDVHFMPDTVGDLYFNGEASDVDRKLYSAGLQADASCDLGEKNKIRGGALFLSEYVTADSTSTVFPVGPDGNPTGPTEPPKVDDENLYGLFTGLYLQDEWKMFSKLTVNFGGRFDVFNSSFDNEHQLSPRINLIYQPTESTTLHAGYSRYFTPPPVENVSGSDVAKFDGTSGAAPTDADDPVKAERSNYYDVGISQKLAPGLTVGLDGYYKQAHNQLDDGLFGQTLILSAFNYAKGQVYGVEFTGSYAKGGFSSYANLAWSVAKGEDWNSAQFLFDPADAAYVKNNWIYLDHDQRLSGSFGVAYTWNESKRYSTRLYADALYGSGLRADGGGVEDAAGDPIPNGASVPEYYSINFGAEQSFTVGKGKILKARLDVVNVTDNSYELRDGSGVGVNAAQFGERLGFFGSLSFVF